MQRRTFMLGSLSLATLTRTGAASAFPGGDQAVIPESEFYTRQTRERWGAWGPPARQFPAPAGLVDEPAWLQRRLLTTARRYIGLGYQHHHVPAFDPPGDWPWISVSAGRNEPGLDCSNFTSLVFNTTLGIKLPTAIADQAETVVVGGPGNRGTVTLARIAPTSYEDAVATLRPADLLFIHSDAGPLSHVVLWIGEVHGTPSFIDCTDAVRQSIGGDNIPTGVQVRPFLPDNWYGRRFAYAHRLENLGTGSGAGPVFGDGGDV